MADISVAISTLHRPAGLARCLEAVLGGTVLPGEVIVVDQGGDAEPVVDRVAGGEVPVHYVPQPRRGLAASRNAALRRARCAIVATTDDDCVPAPQWIEAIERAFRAHPVAAVSGRVLPLGPDAAGMYAVSLRSGDRPETYRRGAVPWAAGTGGNLAVRREWLGMVGPYDERLGAGAPGRAAEDADLLYRLLQAGATVRFEPDAVVFHERQSRDRRLAAWWSYGHGIGAFAALWARRGDVQPSVLLGQRLFRYTRALTRACLTGDRGAAHDRALAVRGMISGFVWGLQTAEGWTGEMDGPKRPETTRMGGL